MKYQLGYIEKKKFKKLASFNCSRFANIERMYFQPDFTQKLIVKKVKKYGK